MNTSSGFLASLPWPQRLTTVAAFAVPALALWLPSGYSYGAALLLAGALLTLHRWPRQPQAALTRAFAVAMLVMAVLWVALADPAEDWGRWDRPAKFVLGAACLCFATVFPPRPQAILWGLVAGSLGGGAIALWQVYGLGMGRASGYTNAIQYGNLALLMAVMLAIFTTCMRRQLAASSKVLCAVAVLAGVNASMLSQSRGGWLALLAALPFGLLVLFRIHRAAFWRTVAGLCAALAMLSAVNSEVLAQRWEEMAREMQIYEQKGDAGTSVGQRLEHWRLAWNMGRERPLLGWGVAGYTAEKQARVAAGQYHASIVEYKFVHNEVLDLFVKLGLAGVAVLCFFYALPIAMFWPGQARMAACAGQPKLWRQALALRLCGVCVPVLYMGFGLTQVFFAHNSGIMFYLFMLMLLWAALAGVERQAAASAA